MIGDVVKMWCVLMIVWYLQTRCVAVIGYIQIRCVLIIRCVFEKSCVALIWYSVEMRCVLLVGCVILV